MTTTAGAALAELIRIVKTLRGPEGCPWDKKQTHKSLVPYLLEESHEVIEAINEENHSKLKEELGDLLLHIVFQAVLGEEQNRFQLADAIQSINQKLKRRHPHVFSDTQVDSIADIKKNWEAIKKEEGRQSLMEGLPKTFPALLQARRIQERASEVDFDWDSAKQVWEKIREEVQELRAAIAAKNNAAIEDEMGDLLFSIVNLSRFLSTNPEEALKKTNRKFIRRFKIIEQTLAERELEFKDLTLRELDEIWNQAKEKESNSPG